MKKRKTQTRKKRPVANKPQTATPNTPKTRQAKVGDTVILHYRKKLAINNAVIEESRLTAPFQFKIGDQQVMPSFENAIIGMSKGEKKEFFVPAAQAHGEILRENLFIVKREQIKANFSYQVGQVLLFQQQNGQKLGAEVLKITPTSVILNANNPLAGEDLYFDVEILEII